MTLKGFNPLVPLIIGSIFASQIFLLCHARKSNTHDGGQRSIAETRFLQSEESGILLPPDDKYNFVGEDNPQTTEAAWRSPRNSFLPATTVVSTSSYSIRPGPNDSGSAFIVNTKPIPVVTTVGSHTSNRNREGENTNYRDKNTVFVKNNCFGPRCKGSGVQDAQSSDNDEWKSYHYVMNKGVNQKQKRLYNPDISSRRNDRHFTNEMTMSIPFIVDPMVSKYHQSYPSKAGRRVLRTTTPSSSAPPTTTPGWIKLQPILPDFYDPFMLKSNTTAMKLSRPYQNPNPSPSPNPSSQFSNRLGELSPESFAERWGWDGDNGDKGYGSGSHYTPHSWLQDNRHGSGSGGNSPDRDPENRNWVKLEPIPVAGVTISKWVPKGTQNSELPSTNWPSRDRIPSGNGIGHTHSNPTSTKWWDILDNINQINRLQQNRPQSQNPYDAPPRGWSPNQSHAPPQSQSSWGDRTPQNPWGDVIYPNGPGSATVSWQQDKDLSKYGSSFPGGSPSSSPWQSDIHRPPSSATGSWTADDNRRYGSGSASYPDRHSNKDDQRWVMVSNSRKVSVSTDRQRPGYNHNDGNKYRPSFDKFSDFPFYEPPPYNNRRGKDYKDLFRVTNLTVTKQGSIDQDIAFKKVNATLAKLTPVLNQKGGTKTGTKSSMPAFLKPYFGSGRGMKNTDDLAYHETSTQKGAKLKINPVYAAVGAGMIPATMAAVLPMVLGRKRREVLLTQRRASNPMLDPLISHFEINSGQGLRFENTVPRRIRSQPSALRKTFSERVSS